jgi:hypothetical protein
MNLRPRPWQPAAAAGLLSLAFAPPSLALEVPAKFDLSLGVDTARYQTTTQDRTPEVSGNGGVSGARLALLYRSAGAVHWGLEGRYSQGSPNVDQGATAVDPDYSEAEGRLFVGYPAWDSSDPETPVMYLGVGYRQTDKSYSGGSLADRTSSHAYLPLGLLAPGTIAAGWSAETRLEAGPIVWGSVDADTSYAQNSGYEARASITFIRDFGDSSGLGVGPYVRYWNLQESETKGGTSIPETRETESGVRLELIF